MITWPRKRRASRRALADASTGRSSTAVLPLLLLLPRPHAPPLVVRRGLAVLPVEPPPPRLARPRLLAVHGEVLQRARAPARALLDLARAGHLRRVDARRLLGRRVARARAARRALIGSD